MYCDQPSLLARDPGGGVLGLAHSCMYCDQPSLPTRDPGGGVNEEIPHRWTKQPARIYFLQISTTVVPYCSTGYSMCCSASARSIRRESCSNLYSVFVFEHLHTSIVMFYNKYASLGLHDSDATSASTPQEYSVMHSVCFFLRAFALIKI